jgi:hypothetical protein
MTIASSGLKTIAWSRLNTIALSGLLKRLVFLCVLCASAVGSAFCQTNYNATIGPLIAYTNQATAAPTATFRNIGQCNQWLYYQVTGTTTAINIELEGASDPVNGPWTQISPVGTSLTTGMISASTWMPFLRANIVSISGAAPVVNAQYYASTQCGTGQGGLAGSAISSQPVTFVTASSVSGTATVAAPLTITGTAGPSTILFGGTVYNATGGVVYLVINNTTSPVTTTSSYILAVAANSSAQLVIPTIGLAISNGGGLATKAYCTTSLTVPADPATACQLTILFKTGILVNGNVSTAGAQQGGSQQNGNPPPG